MKTYTYNNQQIVLLHDSEVKSLIADVLPVASMGDKYNPYILTDEIVGLIYAGKIEAHKTYEDGYNEYDEENDGGEIVYAEIRNAENSQHLIYDWVGVDWVETDKAERELCVTTDTFHDWTSERRSMIEKLQSGGNISELKKEWETIVESFNTSDVYEDYSWDGIIEEANL